MKGKWDWKGLLHGGNIGEGPHASRSLEEVYSHLGNYPTRSTPHPIAVSLPPVTWVPPPLGWLGR